MFRIAPIPRQTGLGHWWIVLLTVCVLFGVLRGILERQRLHDAENWARRGELNRRLWDAWGISSGRAQVILLNDGKGMELRAMDNLTRGAEIPGRRIGVAYEGWTLVVRFSRGPLEGFPNEVLAAGRVVPPPGMILRKEPTALWWFVEYLRAIVMIVSMLAWAWGLLLIVVVRGVRQYVARWCMVAAVVSMFAAWLASDFNWKFTAAGPSRWFEGCAFMAAIAVLLRLIPSRRLDPARCAACRYDLTGNESGVCPECGCETPWFVRQKRLDHFAPVADRLVNVIAAPFPDDAEMNKAEEDPEAGSVQTFLCFPAGAHAFPDGDGPVEVVEIGEVECHAAN